MRMTKWQIFGLKLGVLFVFACGAILIERAGYPMVAAAFLAVTWIGLLLTYQTYDQSHD